MTKRRTLCRMSATQGVGARSAASWHPWEQEQQAQHAHTHSASVRSLGYVVLMPSSVHPYFVPTRYKTRCSVRSGSLADVRVVRMSGRPETTPSAAAIRMTTIAQTSEGLMVIRNTTPNRTAM